MTTLLELAERAEAATADEQRSLLEEAFYAVHGAPLEAHEMPAEEQAAWIARETRFFTLLRAEAFLDAAMTLRQRLDGPFILTNADLDDGVDYTKWRCALSDGDVEPPTPCATPTLALVAASLRSRAQQDSPDA